MNTRRGTSSGRRRSPTTRSRDPSARSGRACVHLSAVDGRRPTPDRFVLSATRRRSVGSERHDGAACRRLPCGLRQTPALRPRTRRSPESSRAGIRRVATVASAGERQVLRVAFKPTSPPTGNDRPFVMLAYLTLSHYVINSSPEVRREKPVCTADSSLGQLRRRLPCARAPARAHRWSRDVSPQAWRRAGGHRVVCLAGLATSGTSNAGSTNCTSG